jgi:methionyl-tRNA synthetase
MSKTLGNVVDPIELIQKYENGADALRYYFLREIPPFADGDFSERRFAELYNADLANGLGNLAARLAKLIQNNNISLDTFKIPQPNTLFQTISPLIEQYKFNEALGMIWTKIKNIDKYINDKKPWEQNANEFTNTIAEVLTGSDSVDSLLEIIDVLQPFLPHTATQLIQQFTGKEPFTNKPLFPRISTK